jgi:hypothetical protein
MNEDLSHSLCCLSRLKNTIHTHRLCESSANPDRVHGAAAGCQDKCGEDRQGPGESGERIWHGYCPYGMQIYLICGTAKGYVKALGKIDFSGLALENRFCL